MTMTIAELCDKKALPVQLVALWKIRLEDLSDQELAVVHIALLTGAFPSCVHLYYDKLYPEHGPAPHDTDRECVEIALPLVMRSRPAFGEAAP